MRSTAAESDTSDAATPSRASSVSTPEVEPPKLAPVERLKVAVRVRPLRGNETLRVLRTLGPKTVVVEDDTDKTDVLRAKRTGNERRYAYDNVFPEETSQEQVYEATTHGLVRDVLAGYNATVFAYGATGSGKTHTMVGSTREPGIMVRALNDLFKAVGEASHPDRYEVTMSYLEIYNENIRDLLNPESGFLELREDSRGRSITVARLTEVSTISTDEVMGLLHMGNKARTVESTAANKTSSRSHALLSVTVRHTTPESKGSRVRIKQGRLFMIDLAGSERAANTKNRGKRLQEGAHINRSLLALGNCITALCGGARYVNYRDSKLTRLLKEALSGNCRTVMVAHVSPAVRHRDESKQTLLYAERANNISNKVERNVLDVSYHVNQYQGVISELRDEIERLRTKMTEERPRLPSGHVRQQAQGKHIKRIREQIVSTFKEQMRLRRKLMDVDGQLLSLSSEAERQHLLISNWESRNNKLYKNNKNYNSKNYTDDSDKETLEPEASEELHKAWAGLANVEREQEIQTDLRDSIERELEDCRQRGIALEEELPSQTSTEDEAEMLALMLRCHELEVEKMALQSERLIKQHELRRRDVTILRFDRQRQLCETIITRQRELIEEGCIKLPPDLQELYRLYQQEIHAATYTEAATAPPVYQHPIATAATYTSKLPPIPQSIEPLFQRSMRVTTEDNLMGLLDTERPLSRDSSGDGSEFSTSPGPNAMADGERMSHSNHLPPPAVLFPPISDPRGLSTTTTSQGMRRMASDENMSSTPDTSRSRSRSRYRWGR